MRISSKLSKSDYLSAMKERMGGHCEFGKERFTGFFFGPVFSVTHHSGWEYNRRFTNVKNTAIGIVKKADDGCTVSCFCVKGLLVPTQFLPLYLIILSLVLIPVLFAEAPILAEDMGAVAAAIGIVAAIALGCMAFYTCIYTLLESFTEASIEGGKILRACLLAPDDPFSYINNKNKV